MFIPFFNKRGMNSNNYERRNAVMEGTKDILQGKWKELKGKARMQWGKLTDDDLERMHGKTEELSGILQQRYGYSKEKADKEIHDWMRKNDKDAM
jgi:uncharacterized protein YjbJ (UPF0337 family)